MTADQDDAPPPPVDPQPVDRDAIARCRMCDPNGWRDAGDDTVVRCDHQAPTPRPARSFAEPLHGDDDEPPR